MMGLLANNSQLGTHSTNDMVSDQLLAIFNTVNLAILAAGIALCGIIANVLNIVVFVKQGLNDTVNIGLFGLALSDLCSLITLEGVCVFRNRIILHELPVVADEVQHLMACWPHACFARITSSITVYITLERCLCVVIPLKVKNVITPRMTTCVVVGIYLTMIVTVIPEYTTCYMGWRFIPEQNRSLLGLLLFPGKYEMTTLNFNIAVGTQVASFGALIVFSVLLVVKLKEISKWRQSISTCGGSLTKDTNSKENRTMKMITLVALIYCTCFLPMLGCFITVTFVPGFIGFGAYNNTFFLCFSFAFLFDSINSTVNILVYYRMSTKFRITFLSLLCQKPDDMTSNRATTTSTLPDKNSYKLQS